MLKEVMSVVKTAKKASLFLGGVAFGTAGLKLLSSRDAKQVYAKVIAKTYQVKDCVDASVSKVKQHADDVLKDAQSMYESQKQAEQVGE